MATTLQMRSGALLLGDAETQFRPVMDWDTDETGKRRPSTRQSMRDGKRVWEVELSALVVSYGTARREFVTVQVLSDTEPDAEMLTRYPVAGGLS